MDTIPPIGAGEAWGAVYTIEATRARKKIGFIVLRVASRMVTEQLQT